MFPVSRLRDRFRTKTSAVIWTPAELSLALWLDAADASTITLNGSTVSQWDDKSGNGRNATQATATYQPTYSVGVFNGMNALTLDGTDDFVAVNDYTSTNTQTFVVCRTSDVTTRRHVTRKGLSTGFLEYSLRTENGVLNALSVAASAASASISGATINTSMLLGHTWDGSEIRAWLNGVSGNATALSGTQFNGTLRTRIGASFASDSDASAPAQAWIGEIAEFIQLSSAISTSDRQKIEGYLAWKWGLEGSLPASHPYKTRPPTV